MNLQDTVCPVCTLYLRQGITLKAHLTSHPKQKVIDALINLTSPVNESKDVDLPSLPEPAVTLHSWNQPTSNIPPVQGNHSFIYQQFMSTTNNPSTNLVSVNPITQQYVSIPAVFSPPIVCQPYLYQQQQVLMSAGTSVPSLPPIPSKVIDFSQAILGKEKQNFNECNDVGKQTDLNLIKKISNVNKELTWNDQENENRHSQQKKEEDANVEHSLVEFEDRNDNLGSPASSTGSVYLHVRTDLNKACQTVEGYHISETNDVNKDDENYNVEQNDQVISMNGMQLVLCNVESQVEQVNDFDYVNNEKTDLINIGGMNGDLENACAEPTVNTQQLSEESVSRESVHMSIRADERMPPRGELSGQESNGAVSDVTWSQIQCEGNSPTLYNLPTRENWEGSNCSSSEVPPYQSRNPLHYNQDLDDKPAIVSVTEVPLKFKCRICGKGFTRVKDRRLHQSTAHNSKTDKINYKCNSKKKISKDTIKKIDIQPKKPEIKNETNFDIVFRNKFKIDNNTNKNEGNKEEVIENHNNECDTNGKEFLNCNICTDCSSVFFDPESLKEHRQQLHPKNYYKCDTCEQIYKTELEFNEHLKIHPLECSLCGKLFYRRYTMKLHMKRHLGIKLFACPICSKRFLTKQNLQEHINVHTGETPIKCKLCDETFRRHSNLVHHRNRQHLNKKNTVKDFMCFCGEVLHSKKKLEWHKEIHDEKPKACPCCKDKFIHMASLTRHMRKTHNERFLPTQERAKENVECPICQGVYLKTSLETHIRSHTGNKSHTCTICTKSFSSKWNLKLHKWTHTGRALKPYKCDQCERAFIRESDYIAHMNSHKSIKPYTCNHCGVQFIRKYNCQRHVKEHEKQKSFSCNICGKHFHRSYYLKDHMRVHSGERPYCCHICGKASSTKSNHNKHLLIHHAKEPVSTEN